MVVEQVTTLQKKWFLRTLQRHCTKRIVFGQVTTTLQKSCGFLSKLQHHSKKLIVFDKVTSPLQKAYSF